MAAAPTNHQETPMPPAVHAPHAKALLAVLCLGAALAPACTLAADDADITALRQEVAELRARVARLEADVASGVAVNPARQAQPVKGGWQAAQNWGLLSKGMDKSRVEEILGEAQHTRSISKFDIWRYGKGEVRFYLGRVSSWHKP